MDSVCKVGFSAREHRSGPVRFVYRTNARRNLGSCLEEGEGYGVVGMSAGDTDMLHLQPLASLGSRRMGTACPCRCLTHLPKNLAECLRGATNLVVCDIENLQLRQLGKRRWQPLTSAIEPGTRQSQLQQLALQKRQDVVRFVSSQPPPNGQRASTSPRSTGHHSLRCNHLGVAGDRRHAAEVCLG
jgi:hypothetical protein